MFYSTRADVLSSQWSHIEFDRIFCGQYWDDLSCAGFLGGNDKKHIAVLMLGLADGAAVRPILATGRVKRFIGVDIDGVSATQCRKLYAQQFPNLDFEVTVSEAKRYLETSGDTFDVIVVDLFTEDAYASVVFAQEFHALLANHLNKAGHVIFNAYGIPMHLDPFQGDSPQRYLVQVLEDCWGDVRYLPYRRNATLIVGQGRCSTDIDSPPGELRLGDRLFLNIMRLRLRELPRIALSRSSEVAHVSYTAINNEMRKRWLAILPELNAMTQGKVDLRQPSDLRNLLGMPQECRALQERLMAENHSLIALLPVLVAGEINCSDFDARWLPEWALDVLRTQWSDVNGKFVTYCLPQAFAVVINRSNRYRSMLFHFQDALLRIAARELH